jgi:hypothetical protein
VELAHVEVSQTGECLGHANATQERDNRASGARFSLPAPLAISATVAMDRAVGFPEDAPDTGSVSEP